MKEPFRHAVAGLALRRVRVARATIADIDTPDDLARATAELTPTSNERTPAMTDTEAAAHETDTAPKHPKHLPPEALDAWLTAAAAIARGLPLTPSA